MVIEFENYNMKLIDNGNRTEIILPDFNNGSIGEVSFNEIDTIAEQLDYIEDSLIGSDYDYQHNDDIAYNVCELIRDYEEKKELNNDLISLLKDTKMFINDFVEKALNKQNDSDVIDTIYEMQNDFIEMIDNAIERNEF